MIGALLFVLMVLGIWFAVSVVVALFVGAFIRVGHGPEFVEED